MIREERIGLINIIGIIWISLALTPGFSQAMDEDEPLWGYEGGVGPKHWGEIEKDHDKHLLCREGEKQSPINIEHSRSSTLVPLEFHYLKSSIQIINNGHTVHLSYDPGSYVNWGDQKFDLVQFHFHHPSEHRLNGKTYDMELHLVHKTPRHRYVVISIFMKKGQENAALKKLWGRIPNDLDREEVYDEDFTRIADFLPKKKTLFHYFGSLTTPPCSQLVNWFVMESPIEVSESQIKYFQKFIDHNARPVQPLNGRVVVEISSGSR
jgi:carbonic anhydrase